jgi:archaellum biogenesis ATPase FlaH
VIQFPETAQVEWQIVADAARVADDLRARLALANKIEAEVDRLRIRHHGELLFQQELDSDLTPVLEMMTLNNYQSTPSAGPRDLIEGVVKANGLTVFLGPSGSGKSTMALQMCYSLMTGKDWLGQPVQQINGAVGALSYDMDGALMLDWMSGFPGIDASKVHVVNAHKRGNPLGVPVMRAQIAAAWKATQVEVIVVDSFGASFFGHDQNDAAATMAHYRDLTKFALHECGAKAVIVLSHSTESNPHRARGSTTQHDVADTIVSIYADAQQQRHLRMVKYRQHRDAQGVFTSQMDPVIVTVPNAVSHLVELDLGAMTLAGLQLPAGAAAAAFTDMPETYEAPDTDSDSQMEDDDL